MADEPGDFEAPHPNGAAPARTPRRAARAAGSSSCSLFVALIASRIILGWTLVGSHSPERLDDATAAQVATVCNDAQAHLKALPQRDPSAGAEVVRARSAPRTRVLRTMIARGFAAVHRDVEDRRPRPLRGWTADWSTRDRRARATSSHDLDTNRRRRPSSCSRRRQRREAGHRQDGRLRPREPSASSTRASRAALAGRDGRRSPHVREGDE